MKKIIAFLLVAIMAISLVACDLGNTDNPGKTDNSSQTQGGENKGGKETVEVTADNWESVIKDKFNLELNLPDGWTIKEVKTRNSGKIEVKLIPGGSVSYEDFGSTIFEEMQKKYTEWIGSYVTNQEFRSFEEANTNGIAGIKAIATDGSAVSVEYQENTETISLSIKNA